MGHDLSLPTILAVQLHPYKTLLPPSERCNSTFSLNQSHHFPKSQGFLAGLWVSLLTIGGNASRATDLGMYSARLAVNCAWKVATQKKAVKGVKNGEVLYFAAAMGVLMSLYEVSGAQFC